MKNYEAPEMKVMEAVADTRLAGTVVAVKDLWENDKLAFTIEQKISDSEAV